MDHSEVKHLPKVDHTPAELDEPSKLLLKAADLIEARGLAKYMTCDELGRMCVRGALLAAEGIAKLQTRHGRNFYMWGDGGDTANKADQRMFEAVGMEPQQWNNDALRTADEVVAKLRAVALGG